ncbi:protein EARLY-RESPONSIVE TO DEHYDRATION 7, chloroplastic isoform X2 [Spinacia oleracea]|uniref:Protein EARLY-RESPONSIVE TO DEHYDRATION 7, chloroplastic isoform X2 n=1 Tax=Spinacia oleracea TaxID=3562 RepID=A0A9R0INW8_SPIOL|nr:protein EARLY-RESPONSIVE TO DEHYDRATION 7, chloroplastic-like isoform X2 [Spinacia oleracea]
MDGNTHSEQPSAAIDATEELLIKIPAAIVHLIDNQQSVELANGDLEIILLRQDTAGVAVLARIGDQLQWPLTKDEATLKLDDSHYFFTFSSNGDVLNYGLTIPSKGQEKLLKKFDSVLEKYSGFKEERVEVEVEREAGWVVAREVTPEEVKVDMEKREIMEESAAAYWTTLAPNVEEYSNCVARMIAAGSGMLVKGIMWCGDVTVERLKWGNEFLRKRLGTKENAQVSPQCLSRIRRVKSMTKKSEDAATAILSGVIKVSDTITGSVVNSRVGKTFFNMFPGEIILASFDEKICDAVEAAGKNVMSTSSHVTTELVTERYGEEAAQATNEGLDAAGHALGTAWTVFKLRKALNPKGALKPTTLAKAAVGKVKKSL